MFLRIAEIAEKEMCHSIDKKFEDFGLDKDSLVKCHRNKFKHYIIETKSGMINAYKSSIAYPRYLAITCHLCEKKDETCQDCDPIWDFGK